MGTAINGQTPSGFVINGNTVNGLASLGKIIYLKESYIEDGLVIHLDGYIPPDGLVWQDISISENHVTLPAGVTYDAQSKGYVFNGTGRGISSKILPLTAGNPEFTVETVYTPSALPSTLMGSCWFGALSYTGNLKTFCVAMDPSLRIFPDFINVTLSSNARMTLGQKQSFSFAKSTSPPGATDNVLVVDNVVRSYTWNSSSGAFAIPQSQLYVGQFWPYGGDNRYLKGTIHSIRIYNRKLTLNEQQHNYTVDAERFGLQI